MNYDLLVHADLNDASRFGMALGNITNYLNALPDEKYTVVLLVNGAAAPFVKKEAPHADAISELLKRGVSFRVCANAMKKADITQGDLIDGVAVVPAGMVELVHLQRAGFAYIKP